MQRHNSRDEETRRRDTDREMERRDGETLLERRRDTIREMERRDGKASQDSRDNCEFVISDFFFPNTNPRYF